MHLSMHNWMRAEPLEVTVRRLAKYGYESIEISGEPDKYNTKEVRKLLQEHNLRCWGAVTLMFPGLCFPSKDQATREKTVKYVKDCITMIKELEGEEITIVPGTVGKVNPDATPEQEWQWAVDGLKECYAHGQASGVKLALEPLNRFETYFISRGDQALALAEAVGPNCGVCLDAFHLNIEEADMLATIRRAGNRLYDFHVADNNRLACGMGSLNWSAIIRTLKSIGYDGAVTVEFVAPVDRTPANPFPNAVEKNPVNISPEQLKFIEDHGSSLLSEEFYDWLVGRCAQVLLPLIKDYV
ncbi:MAG: sugar phosphate isomerase/epimerase family protein [Caldilineaceae bacterium]